MIKLEAIISEYPEIKGVHPACEAVPPMSDDSFNEFMEDIGKRGLIYPITLTNDGLLLDGRHRLIACYETQTEPRFERTGVSPWDHVNSVNIKRRFLTVGQKAMFAQAWFEHEKALAKERQSQAGKAYGRGQEKLQVTLPEAIDKKPPPQSRDRTAAKAGVGQSAVDKAARIIEHAPDIAEEVKKGKIDLEPAYREARKIERQKKAQPTEGPTSLVLTATPMHETASIITVDGQVKEIAKPQSVRFNKTNDAVDWARWTWNPVTGCLHGCEFCYAREIATSQRMEQFYPFGFEPAFHEYRLSAPLETKVPDSNDPRDRRVFVCSMADLFGKWVPDEWIQKVFDACLRAPAWEYLFLTKWPNRYASLPLIERAWYGASVIQQSDVTRVEKAMKAFDGANVTRWVSMEPMLEPIQFNDLSWCDLMVIGSQTQTYQPDGLCPAIPAKFDDICDVVYQCREFGVPYYLKANVGLDLPGMELPKMSPRRRN